MTKKILFVIFAVLAILVGLYPSIYFLMDRKFGLLNSKPDDLLNNIFWNIEFYQHIILGGIALLIGWTQFIVKIRTTKVQLHRTIGKVYVIAALLSSLAAVYIALYATGGAVPALGFICLAIVWFSSTSMAYFHIKNKRIEEHQKMMIYSYAACFAAVTLRIYLPLLTILFGDFIKAYSIVAWLCWIPNIIAAYFITKKLSKQGNETLHIVNIDISRVEESKSI
jgi:uncharacterized membrane protein